LLVRPRKESFAVAPLRFVISKMIQSPRVALAPLPTATLRSLIETLT
jgi:hypothetical protein